jgi:competence protein ComEC
MVKPGVHSVPALTIASVFALGILAGKRFAVPFELLFPFALAFLAASVVLFLVQRNPRLTIVLAASLVLLILVSGAASIRFEMASVPSYQSKSSDPVQLFGRIIEQPVRIKNRIRFTFRAEAIRDSSHIQPFSTDVLVTVTRRKKDTTEVPFAYGSIMMLKGQLARPAAERNPGEFDARKYYEAQGISHVMRVRGYEDGRILDSSGEGGVRAWLMRRVVIPVREYCIALIDSTIGGEEGELLKGVFVGERTGIAFSTRSAFANSGISHLLAVSGAHVAIVWGILSVMFAVLRFPRTWRIGATLVSIALYALITGSHPPIVRAAIMGSLLQLGKLLGERTNGLNSLGVAALVILAYDPRQLFDVGFQLSFAAVGSLICLFPIAKALLPSLRPSTLWGRTLSRSLELSMVTLVVTLGTLPLMAGYFGKVSVVGLVTNILVVPAVGASITLGFLSSLFGWFSFAVADAYAAVNTLLLKFALWMAEKSGSLSWASVETLWFTPAFAVPFYSLLGILFHLRMQRVVARFAIVFLASMTLLVFFGDSSADDEARGNVLRVSFIDVGQGDAAFVEFPDGRTMVIDAGPKSEEYDSGERIVAPFLRRRGIRTIDYLVASHPHNDHIGGIPTLFKEFEVKKVIESGQPARDPIYQEYTSALREERCRVDTVRAKRYVVEIGGAKLYALYPTSSVIDADTTHPHPNLNNTSVVLKLCFGKTSILFCGDAEAEAETEIVGLYGGFLRSSVLKAGHHGSRTSSTPEFLAAVKPAMAIISVGLHNKFNHPSRSVVERLHAMHVDILRTDEEGAIILESDGTAFRRIEWR